MLLRCEMVAKINAKDRISVVGLNLLLCTYMSLLTHFTKKVMYY